MSSPGKNGNLAFASPQKHVHSPFRTKKSKLDYLIENIQMSQEKLAKQPQQNFNTDLKENIQGSHRKSPSMKGPLKFDATARSQSKEIDCESQELLQVNKLQFPP